MVLQDAAGAIPYFERAVEILPTFVEAHYNLGGAATKIAAIPKAIAAYRAVQRYCEAGDDLAERARGQLQGLEDILLANSSFPSLDAYLANLRLFDEAFQCLTDRQFNRAVELFKRVLSGNPKHVQSYGNLALAHAGLGERSAAMACFDRALELDPTYEPARANRTITSKMKEGEPFLPGIQEVDYYSERRRTQQAAKVL
jgi:tetratricopeptide (TPR) repeat protein